MQKQAPIRLKALLPALIAVAYLLANCPFACKGLNVYDEGLMTYVAQRVHRGEVMYRDVSKLETPGSYYLLAVCYGLFGESLFVGRMLALAVGLALGVAIWLLGRRVAGDCAAAAAALCFCFWGTLHWPSPWYTWPATCLVLLSALAVDRCLRTEHARWAVVSGLLSGVSFLFKQNIGVGLPIALGVLALVAWGSRTLTRLAATVPREVLSCVLALAMICVASARYVEGIIGLAVFGLLHVARQGETALEVPPLRSAGMFAAGLAIPPALFFVMAYCGGYLREAFFDTFLLATHYKSVTLASQWAMFRQWLWMARFFLSGCLAVGGGVFALRLLTDGRRVAGWVAGVGTLALLVGRAQGLRLEAIGLCTFWGWYDVGLVTVLSALLAIGVVAFLGVQSIRCFRSARYDEGVFLAVAAAAVVWIGCGGRPEASFLERRPVNLLGVTAALLAMPVALDLGRRLPAGRVWSGRTVVWAGCVACAAAAMLTGMDFVHGLLAAPPAFVVLAMWSRSAVGRWLSVLAAGWLCIAGYNAALRGYAQRYAQSPPIEQTRPMAHPRARGTHADAGMAGETEAVAEAVAEMTKPSDSVFVYSPNLMIYFLAGRRFESRYFDLMLEPIPLVREAVLADLASVKAAVVQTRAHGHLGLFIVPEIVAYLRENFEERRSFEHYVLLARKEIEPELPPDLRPPP